MTRTTAMPNRPGERGGRPQLTSDGQRLITERVDHIRGTSLPALRPLLVEHERDERNVAEFERLVSEAERLESLVAASDVITADAARFDGRVDLGMRVHVTLENESTAWVRPVHPEEAFLDEERVSVTAPLATALIGSRVGQTVWVAAPTGVWACNVLEIDSEATS